MSRDQAACAPCGLPCGLAPPAPMKSRRLFCRRASTVDTALVCDLLTQARASPDQPASEVPSFASCFESFGLAVPPLEELSASVEDLLSSSFLSQLCEDEDGTLVGFMALGHSPIVPCPFAPISALPSSLVKDPTAQEICCTQCNQWFSTWPQWLRERYSCNRRQARRKDQSESTPGSEKAPSFDSDSDSSSDADSSGEWESRAPSNIPLSSGGSADGDGFSESTYSVTRLGDGSCINPTNTLWLLLFTCREPLASSNSEAVTPADVAKAMLQSAFASMYELQWVLRLQR